MPSTPLGEPRKQVGAVLPLSLVDRIDAAVKRSKTHTSRASWFEDAVERALLARDGDAAHHATQEPGAAENAPENELLGSDSRRSRMLGVLSQLLPELAITEEVASDSREYRQGQLEAHFCVRGLSQAVRRRIAALLIPGSLDGSEASESAVAADASARLFEQLALGMCQQAHARRIAAEERLRELEAAPRVSALDETDD